LVRVNKALKTILLAHQRKNANLSQRTCDERQCKIGAISE
jgi:hypothetical protein